MSEIGFKLIETLDNKWTGDASYEDYSDEHYAFQDKRDKLTKISDLIRITPTKGEPLLCANHNFNTGTCGCCAKHGSHSSILKYEFFKLIEEKRG